MKIGFDSLYFRYALYACYAIFYMEQGQGKGDLIAQDHARGHLRESQTIYSAGGDPRQSR